MVTLFRRKAKNTRNSGENARSGSEQDVETTVFRVKIPPNVQPGDEFQVYGE